ncbi:hypothetical protein [Massilia rubra]|uniref:SMP-30/Gluconolactonase/LRE-like region domain-containing protein n=1 Tax=Massilia rubra TaxID=2607910 RepID=A0ABX0LHW0_9BURK|nr:hypothetical protein [Massilia rubra]NHZ34406.1 hypothetical protein [Massilia rubra]
MPTASGERRSILLSLAVVAAGVAAALYHFPRQPAYAAEARQRERLAQAPRVEVIVDGEHMVHGMAVDARGTLYITTIGEDDVYALSKPGQRVRFTDQDEQESNPSRHRSLESPSTLTADAMGNLYALDASGPRFGCFASARVKRIAADGKVSALAHADTAMAPRNIGGGMMPIAVDKTGALYMLTQDGPYKVSGAGKLFPQPVPEGEADYAFPPQEGVLAAHPDGGVVVASPGHGVYRLLPDGRAARLETRGGDCSLDVPIAPVAQDDSTCRTGPHSGCTERTTAPKAPRCKIDALAVDAGGRIFLSDDGRILQVDTDGAISTFFDPAKGPPIPLKNPVQDYPLTLMALGPHGEVYWARFATLYKITPWSRLRRR